MPQLIKSRGFTLIEVLLAVFLLAMIGAMLAQTVSGFVRTQATIREVSDKSRSMNTTLALFESDVHGMIARVVVVNGASQPAYYADAVNPIRDYELVRFSIEYRDAEDAQIIRSGFVAWGFDDDGRLFRDFWPYANRVDESLRSRRVLLAKVKEARVLSWPSNIRNTRQTLDVYSSGKNDLQSLEMPQAVELLFTMEDGRKFRILSSTAPNFGSFIDGN